MAKKTLTISIILPILASITANTLTAIPTNASTIIGDTEYWSISELTALKTEVTIERDALCHGDYNCEDEFRWSLWERGEEYQALNMLDSMIFIATNINLERETITLRYAPYEAPWMRQLGPDQEKEEAGELYMFWLEAGMNDPTIYMHYTNDYVDEIKSGTIEEGLHIVLAKNYLSDGENWLPMGEEVEFSIAGSNLASSPRAIIFDKMISTDPDRAILIGSIGYQECIESPDYQPGMNCQIMLSATHGPIYIPTPYEEKQLLSGSGGSFDNFSPELPILEELDDAIIPKAPNTGVLATKEQRIIEYLMPIVVALACALVGILLIIGPKKVKNSKNKKISKKSQKKSKKTIDIFSALR